MNEYIKLNEYSEVILTKNICILPDHKDIGVYVLSKKRNRIIAENYLSVYPNTNRNIQVKFQYIISESGKLLSIKVDDKNFEGDNKINSYSNCCAIEKWLAELFLYVN